MPRETTKERIARRNAEAEALLRRRAEIIESNRLYEKTLVERQLRLQKFSVTIEIEYDPLTREFGMRKLCCGGVLPASLDMTSEYAAENLQMAAVVTLLPLVAKFAHGELSSLIDVEAVRELYCRVNNRDEKGTPK